MDSNYSRNLRIIKNWINVESLRGDEALALCPFHGDTNPSLFISIPKLIYHCFSCGAKGHLKGNQKKQQNKDVHKNVFNDLLDSFYSEPKQDDYFLPDHYLPLEPSKYYSKPFWDYLVNQREVVPDTIDKFEIGYCVKGDYTDRIIVPLEMGFVARSIHNEVLTKYITGREQRYLYPLGLPKDKLLFNFNPDYDPVILVEGVFDALKLDGFGVNATAILGARVSDSQIEMLCDSNSNTITLAFDSDEAGEQASLLASSQIKKYFDEIKVLELPEGADPGDLDRDSWSSCYSNSKLFRETYNYGGMYSHVSLS